MNQVFLERLIRRLKSKEHKDRRQNKLFYPCIRRVKHETDSIVSQYEIKYLVHS